ncbi:uncharacterized protein LOC130733103 [Lotus japonicus]|uniref:uncharacterized protein LOC130733103 n=1 Tax=Lotus japonicus TaxID=34305 RepID=UPI0025907F8C|nr:uncharacterized protein LOC130733103 [Lotus japonicus]
MRGIVDPEALLFDPEINRTFHYRLAQQRRALASAMAAETNAELEARLRAEFARTQEEQVQEAVHRILQERELEEANRPLRDLNEPVMSYDYPGSIAPHNAEAQNFELRPVLINLISQHQYGGSATEDAHAHLERFIRNCSTTRLPNPELVRLQLFPFSLRDTAEEWLNSQPQGSITTWEDLAKKFTKKFFPRTLLRKLKNDILIFKQEDTENLHEALERFKKLLRKCPQHNLTLGAQVERFYDGLADSARSNLEAAASGEFEALSAQAGWNLINKMAESAVNSTNDRQNRRGVLEIEAYDRMVASNKQLSQQMTAMQRQFQAAKISNVDNIHCGTCGGRHASEDCGADFDEEVKALGNSQNNPYSNTYNPGWRNHPNFSWREQNNFNQGGNNQRQYSNQRFQSQNSGPQQNQDQGSGNGKKSLEELMENFINKADTSFKNHEAAIKNLETQVGQMAKQMSERPSGTMARLSEEDILRFRREQQAAREKRNSGKSAVEHATSHSGTESGRPAKKKKKNEDPASVQSKASNQTSLQKFMSKGESAVANKGCSSSTPPLCWKNLLKEFEELSSDDVTSIWDSKIDFNSLVETNLVFEADRDKMRKLGLKEACQAMMTKGLEIVAISKMIDLESAGFDGLASAKLV